MSTIFRTPTPAREQLLSVDAKVSEDERSLLKYYFAVAGVSLDTPVVQLRRQSMLFERRYGPDSCLEMSQTSTRVPVTADVFPLSDSEISRQRIRHHST